MSPEDPTGPEGVLRSVPAKGRDISSLYQRKSQHAMCILRGISAVFSRAPATCNVASPSRLREGLAGRAL